LEQGFGAWIGIVLLHCVDEGLDVERTNATAFDECTYDSVPLSREEHRHVGSEILDSSTQIIGVEAFDHSDEHKASYVILRHGGCLRLKEGSIKTLEDLARSAPNDDFQEM
jgi:hypothetical protein